MQRPTSKHRKSSGYPVEEREERIYEQGRSRAWWRNLQRQWNQVHGSSWTLDWELCSLCGIELGTLHVGDSCRAWFIAGGPAVAPGSILGAWPSFVGAHSLWWDAMLIFNSEGVGALFLPQLNVPVFVDSSWEFLPFGSSRYGARLRGNQETAWEGEWWLECKIKI